MVYVKAVNYINKLYNGQGRVVFCCSFL